MIEISNPLFLKLKHSALAKKKKKNQNNTISGLNRLLNESTHTFSSPQSIAVALRFTFILLRAQEDERDATLPRKVLWSVQTSVS